MIDELRAYLAWAEDAGLQILAPGTATVKTKLPLLEGVRAEIGECTRCKLHKGRHNIVFGVGDPRSSPDHFFPGAAASHRTDR